VAKPKGKHNQQVIVGKDANRESIKKIEKDGQRSSMKNIIKDEPERVESPDKPFE